MISSSLLESNLGKNAFGVVGGVLSQSACVCVCVRERERERVCVCVMEERERVCVMVGWVNSADAIGS